MRSTILLSLSTLLLATSTFAATVTFDCSKVPNICSNDCYAIQCKGFPSTLHRNSAKATDNRNNNKCKSPNRCSGNPDTSNSCDEYPFASTDEGGVNAVTRCVPAHENSVQGGTLSSFYTRSSVAQGDAYSVAFTNRPAGLQYCNSDCSNSGNELQKRDEISPRFGSQFNKRYFLSSEGHEILMFEPVSAPGSLDSVVGEDTFLVHEDRFVKIVAAM